MFFIRFPTLYITDTLYIAYADISGMLTVCLKRITKKGYTMYTLYSLKIDSFEIDIFLFIKRYSLPSVTTLLLN